MSFSLAGTEERPVVNPCFVIKNWLDVEENSKLKIDGKELKKGIDFSQGIIRDTDGTPAMVIWVEMESTNTTGFEIRMNLD